MKISRLLQSKQTVFPAAFPAAAFSMPPRAMPLRRDSLRLGGSERTVALRVGSAAAVEALLDCYRVATKHSYLLKKVHAWGRLASLCLLEICK